MAFWGFDEHHVLQVFGHTVSLSLACPGYLKSHTLTAISGLEELQGHGVLRSLEMKLWLLRIQTHLVTVVMV